MVRESKCRTCDKMAALSEDELEKILAHYIDFEMNGDKGLTHEDYVKRLNICRNCEHLQNGITCPFCSCLVPVLVRFKDKKCPRPNGALWL